MLSKESEGQRGQAQQAKELREEASSQRRTFFNRRDTGASRMSGRRSKKGSPVPTGLFISLDFPSTLSIAIQAFASSTCAFRQSVIYTIK